MALIVVSLIICRTRKPSPRPQPHQTVNSMGSEPICILTPTTSARSDLYKVLSKSL